MIIAKMLKHACARRCHTSVLSVIRRLEIAAWNGRANHGNTAEIAARISRGKIARGMRFESSVSTRLESLNYDVENFLRLDKLVLSSVTRSSENRRGVLWFVVLLHRLSLHLSLDYCSALLDRRVQILSIHASELYFFYYPAYPCEVSPSILKINFCLEFCVDFQ